MINKHDLFIEVTHCFVKWWAGPSSKIGSGCTPLGSVCWGVKSSPLTQKHSSMGRICLLFCIGVNRKCPLWLMFFSDIDSGAAVRIKCDLNANEFSLQECPILCELRSDLVICCSVSEVISLTHCIVKWWGDPSSINGVTWPRFVRAASAFCLVFSQKWSVLFSMFDLSPLHHVLNWQVFFTLMFAVLLPTFTSYCKIRSRDLTTPTLGVICHTVANTCCTKYAVSIFNRSEDIKDPKIWNSVTWLKPRPFSGSFFIPRERASCIVLPHKICST